jgi:hypothetical protein
MRPFLLGRSRAASFVRWHVQFHTGSYPKNGLTRKSHRKPLMDIARNGLQARKVSRWHIWDARPTAAVLTQPDVPKSEWTSLPDPLRTIRWLARRWHSTMPPIGTPVAHLAFRDRQDDRLTRPIADGVELGTQPVFGGLCLAIQSG